MLDQQWAKMLLIFIKYDIRKLEALFRQEYVRLKMLMNKLISHHFISKQTRSKGVVGKPSHTSFTGSCLAYATLKPRTQSFASLLFSYKNHIGNFIQVNNLKSERAGLSEWSNQHFLQTEPRTGFR